MFILCFYTLLLEPLQQLGTSNVEIYIATRCELPISCSELHQIDEDHNIMYGMKTGSAVNHTYIHTYNKK